MIKTGLRRLTISYSRISFADVATKLGLDSAEDAEFVCAQAVRDAVIEAELDHEQQFLKSSVRSMPPVPPRLPPPTPAPLSTLVQTVQNQYSTLEPQAAFHRRIRFCMEVRNEAVKVCPRASGFYAPRRWGMGATSLRRAFSPRPFQSMRYPAEDDLKKKEDKEIKDSEHVVEKLADELRDELEDDE